MFKSKLRKQAVDDFNTAVRQYEEKAIELQEASTALFNLREKGIVLINLVESRINDIANRPKEFIVKLEQVNVEVINFNRKKQELVKAEKEAKMAGGGVGLGASLSALGIAVATLGPAAAMGVATTFGVASTGTAIASLSGAAAKSAALAWLGGGALTAGGGGMTAGSALITLAGPVGWTIAGVMLTTSLGVGVLASHINEKTIKEACKEREDIEKLIRNFDVVIADVLALQEVTQEQINGLRETCNLISGKDYSKFTEDEKYRAGILVNSTLTLAQLINKEIIIHG